MESNTFNASNFVEILFNIKRLYEECNMEMPINLMVSYKTFDELQKELRHNHQQYLHCCNMSNLVETLDKERMRNFTAYTFQGIVGEFNFIPTRGIPDGNIAVLHSF